MCVCGGGLVSSAGRKEGREMGRQQKGGKGLKVKDVRGERLKAGKSKG